MCHFQREKCWWCMPSAHKSNSTLWALFSFSAFFFSERLDSLVIIVLDCLCHLLTSTSNWATFGAQIGERISNLAGWSYQLRFEDFLWHLALWWRFSSLGLIRGISKSLTQYLGSLITMNHKGCNATKKYFPEPTWSVPRQTWCKVKSHL